MSAQRSSETVTGDAWAALLVIGAGIVSVTVWGGAQVASLVSRARPAPVSPADGFAALFRLPGRLGDPRSAWDPDAAALLPGPVLYWFATSLVALAASTIGVGVYLAFSTSSVGTDRPKRLGVRPDARIAGRGELATLIVRPTGRVIRRYERDHPGELVHLDVKTIGKIPPGGGWRVRGRGQVTKRPRVGYTYLHVAVDDHSRVAYVEAHDDEKAETLAEFWERAQDWFWARGMPIDEVISDNGANLRSRLFAEILAERSIRHRRTRPYRPQTNGKAERFNRTMADEFLYARTFRSENERRRRLDRWIHIYNCHRNHTAVGGPPASRVDNLTGSYT